MNCIISSDRLYKDTITKEVFEYLKENLKERNDYTLYYEYPIYMDIDERILSPKFLIISPDGGVFIVNCSSETSFEKIEEMDEETSQIESYLFSRFVKSNSKLLKESKRSLSFELKSVLFLPLVPAQRAQQYDLENEVCSSNDKLLSLLMKSDKKITTEMQKEICAILEGAKVILKPKKREIGENDVLTKGAILKEMEEQMAYLDLEQKNAALAQIAGPQRIRGLAGSGKTIILCMKAALIHLREPNKKILYTFTTKSLYDYIETMIVRFYRFFW